MGRHDEQRRPRLTTLLLLLFLFLSICVGEVVPMDLHMTRFCPVSARHQAVKGQGEWVSHHLAEVPRGPPKRKLCGRCTNNAKTRNGSLRCQLLPPKAPTAPRPDQFGRTAKAAEEQYETEVKEYEAWKPPSEPLTCCCCADSQSVPSAPAVVPLTTINQLFHPSSSLAPTQWQSLHETFVEVYGRDDVRPIPVAITVACRALGCDSVIRPPDLFSRILDSPRGEPRGCVVSMGSEYVCAVWRREQEGQGLQKKSFGGLVACLFEVTRREPSQDVERLIGSLRAALTGNGVHVLVEAVQLGLRFQPASGNENLQIPRCAVSTLLFARSLITEYGGFVELLEMLRSADTTQYNDRVKAFKKASPIGPDR